ncbi:MAG TPA: phosphatidylserine decarboxylase family protein [Gemmatimonadales bacterium]|nr:phosphatidylserine decarboxylase family protein [Gemmatimonadales bacterium]
MIRTAPEGRWFIVVAWAVALVLIGLAVARTSAWWIVAAAAWGMLAVWVVAFFRDPERAWSRGERLIVSPADGKVVSVTQVEEPAFLQGRAERISIFMNVFDCHVNRYPTDGTVAYRHYNPGEFGHAGAEKASLSNEQSSIGVMTARGKVLIRQIAGLVARRIVTDHQPGQVVHQGERLGMIRFGSRVDLFLPLGTRVLVHVGDTTRVGVTVVAEWS